MTDDKPTPNQSTNSFLSVSDSDKRHLRGMYRDWFLEYASYVILERAVPHIDDGLKPVQRRILHSMKTLDDGRFNKVANIVGNTMQYHPHGDASIYDALVQLGQKDLLVETQGNWGNILTGASAAAARYIEARLSSFALETIFDPKVTEWTLSYDGRKKEPVTLPVKFPLLLFQGVEGIAVGLSSKILPHNFNELLDAAIAYLRNEEFQLYPDFQTGGFIDVSRYNDGERGGSVKIRAKIEKIDNKTLAVTEIPFGRTTGTVIKSILKAMEKGKIKVKKVEDQTAENARIVVHLIPGTSSDKTIDALYAFTDCEVSISPNCCVISEDKPQFMKVSDVLRHGVDTTRNLLSKELHIDRNELLSKLHFASLEKIFIENRIYKDKEFEESESVEMVTVHMRNRLEPFIASLTMPVTDDDIVRLLEIKMKRILKFNADDADRFIASCLEQIAKIDHNLNHLTDYTISWYESLKKKYGAAFPRKTVVRSFDSIEAAKVADANEKLYINRAEGFIGTSLKKDEFICNCSMLDDVLIIYKNGVYKIVKVAEKLAIEKNVLHIAVFRQKDERTTYNVIYQDGKGGTYYMKRFHITGVSRDKEYNITQGKPGSKIFWFSANPNGEAETVKVTLKPKQKIKNLTFDIDFSELAIKGKQSQGNIVTKNEVHSFSIKKRGISTLGGLNIWFDHDVMRLNTDGRGEFLGEFHANDLVLVVLKNGEYFTTNYDLSNHYDNCDILRIEKYRPKTAWTAVLFDAGQGFHYLKRFEFEPSAKRQRYIGDNPQNKLILLTDSVSPRFEISFGGNDAYRMPLEIDATEFVGVKSFKAKGKRLSQFTVEAITDISPEPDINQTDDENLSADSEPEIETDDRSDDDIRDEINGQAHIF